MIGKTAFASRGLWGRAGVHARRPLYAALHRLHGGGLSEWPCEVLVALQLWAQLVRSGRPRSRELHTVGAPAAVLYGDAALSSHRAAAAVWMADGSRPQAFSVVLPAHLVDELGPTPDHAINRAEVWWVAKALDVWGPRLKGHHVLIFNDNTSAIYGCIAGYSASAHVARMEGCIHELLCRHSIHPQRVT